MTSWGNIANLLKGYKYPEGQSFNLEAVNEWELTPTWQLNLCQKSFFVRKRITHGLSSFIEFQRLRPWSAVAEVRLPGLFLILSLYLSSPLTWLSCQTLLLFSLKLSVYETVRSRLWICLCIYRQTGGWAASVCLLASLLLLLETEAGPAAQFPLFLGKIVSPRGAGPGLQDVIHL